MNWELALISSSRAQHIRPKVHITTKKPKCLIITCKAQKEAQNIHQTDKMVHISAQKQSKHANLWHIPDRHTNHDKWTDEQTPRPFPD